jgi:hypothetical protein
MSTWLEQFGVEPTTDPDTIRRWADAGAHHFSVALNELPADGPVHPAVVTRHADHLVTECHGTGRGMVSVADPGVSIDALLGDVAELVASWGCTYMELRSGDR